ncbi:MAG: PAS domain-containing sensor histidine kinase [Caulobacter sp.]|nr:PAS domain-containing sensor histidine kinase [Caulobacter sp.]
MSESASAVDEPHGGPAWLAVWRRILGSRYLLGGAFAVATVLTAVGAYLATSPPGGELVGPASQTVLIVLGVNLVLILGIAVLIGRRVAQVVDEGRGDAGARLHRRFLILFAVAAVAPALVVAGFSGALVTQGVEAWFSQRVRSVVENSGAVARSYVDEQSNDIRNNMMLMSGDLNEAAPFIRSKPMAFGHFMATQASYRGFPGAYLLDREGRVLARAETEDPPPFLAPPKASFQAADEGDISLRPFESADLFRALYRLKGYDDAYLYVVRPVDRGILAHLRETESSLIAYRDAAERRGMVQAAFALSFLETALLVLIAAIWLAITVANSIAVPIGRVVRAAGQVASGHLDARVELGDEPEDIAVLSKAFNSMAGDLQAQQAALTAASLDAESRRMFIETVLLGVSAGVIGVDAGGAISAANRQAARLLDVDGAAVQGRQLSEIAPELGQVWAAALETRIEAETEVDIVRHGETLRLRVRAGVAGDDGVVLTFDDITRLITAQRNAAWRDVARRIAHEIKNPLTPIQLSAERLRRKYRHEITGDLETFDRCTDTIIRQVGDIGRMVDEFSAFARMPTPKFGSHDPAEMLRAGVFALRVASPDIAVEMAEPPEGLVFSCDDRMVGQALTNVLKNAAEAIAGRSGAHEKGRILASLHADEQAMCFIIEDNGVGLPTRDRDRLTEPYVTTREKGTGLGLAIVKRIAEEHGGELLLSDAQTLSGARVVLKFPPVEQASAKPKRTKKVTDGV